MCSSDLQPAAVVERHVRAFNPAPGAWLEVGGERIKVLAAEVLDGSGPAGTVLDDRLTIACGQDAIRPTTVQRAGRGVTTTAELLRGFPVAPGTQL